MTARGPRGLRPDEQELWDRVRQSTVPLKSSKQAAVIDAIKRTNPTPVSEPDPWIAPKFAIGSKAHRGRTTSQMPDGPAQSPVQMDSKKFGRLKRGKLAPEARIDLHGMTVDQAHGVLTRFILNSHSNGCRLVLVITGKGQQTDDRLIPVRRGILRRQVPGWLAAAPLNGVVLQVSESHQKHGGGGALYVYLRRSR